jgi:hypothetical protein
MLLKFKFIEKNGSHSEMEISGSDSKAWAPIFGDGASLLTRLDGVGNQSNGGGRARRCSAWEVSWTQTFKDVVRMSHKHQLARAVLIFHRVVRNLVLRTISIMRQDHRAFEAFDEPYRDLP